MANLYEEDEGVNVRLPRTAITLIAAPASHVSEVNTDTVGLTPPAYKRLVKAGAFPATKVGRLHVASRSAVVSYLDANAKKLGRIRAPKPKPPSGDELGDLLDKVSRRPSGGGRR